MASSANDVWGAIFGATYVYPLAMPAHYDAILVTGRDGLTAGSIRQITYGYEIAGMVRRATEEITGVDHENRTIDLGFRNDDDIVGTFFRSASMVVKVDPNSVGDGPNSRGSNITWTLTYASDSNGSLNLKKFENATARGFETLDAYLMNA
ncbi:unnamed protein product [Linum trigynum]